MEVERQVATEVGGRLLARVREVARSELAPRAAADEAAGRFPREAFTRLGEVGLLGMPYPVEHGGLGQPYEVYLQALEEVAAAWMSVAVGVSVHVMSCYPLAVFGTDVQRAAVLPGLLDGRPLGAFALSEAGAGSDVAAMTTRAKRTDEGYELDGTKAWVTHGGVADHYTTFARVPGAGITAFHVPAASAGLVPGPPERKMGLTSSPTTALHLDRVVLPDDARLGEEGQGSRIALSALESGRLGIAACATGLAQAALELACAYVGQRSRPGRPVAEQQGLRFLLADMAAAVEGARALYLLAARRRDAGLAFGRQSATAKLVATDAAMRVTIDAVQVLGGDGGSADLPAERYLREAKVTQIFEGTNQIQRLVIARHLLGTS